MGKQSQKAIKRIIDIASSVIVLTVAGLKYRKLFFYVFLAALVVHIGLLLFTGPRASVDFERVYEPNAIRFLELFNHTGEFHSETLLSGYYFFRLGYVIFISVVYYVFGIGNRMAIVLIQVVLSSAMFAWISTVLVKKYHSRVIAVVFTCVAFTFFDNIIWTVWCSPEALFRVVFVWSCFTLISLYLKRRITAFFVVTFMSFVALLFIRSDVLILYIPIYVLGIILIISGIRNKKGVNSIVVSTGALLAIVLFLCVIGPEINSLIDVPRGFIINDHVIIGYTSIEAFDYEHADNLMYIISRGIKLIVLRTYQYLNVVPPFWSKWHKMYYAVYMIPLYLLTCIGIVTCWRSRDLFFGVMFSTYLASVLLHALTRVDAALRTGFTGRLLLIICAGYGFDHLYSRYKENRNKACKI